MPPLHFRSPLQHLNGMREQGCTESGPVKFAVLASANESKQRSPRRRLDFRVLWSKFIKVLPPRRQCC